MQMKPGTTPEQEKKLVQLLQALKEKVPTVVDLSVGQTFTPERGQGYTVGLVVRFKDKEGLAIYQPHPEHVKVKEYIAEVCERTMAIDYEF